MNLFRKYLLSSVAFAPEGAAADAGPGGGTGTAETIVERSAGGDGPISIRSAALSLVDTRRKDNAEQARQAPDGDAQPAQESTPQGGDAGPETVPGETQESGQTEETQSPIEPPRSWTKEDKELFKGLPRETQERLADRERSRESDFLKRQNEAADKLKGLTAKEQQAEQVRAQYEHMLPQLLTAINNQHAGEFADIKSQEDVDRLAREDWPRYIVWDASQKRIANVQHELSKAQARQAEENQQKWSTFANEQDALFMEKTPEFADKDRMAKAFNAATELLQEFGFKNKELSDLWHGKKDLSFRDHRIQLVLRDAVKFREAQAAAKKAATKTVPQVQRPGTARPSNADADAKVQALDQRLTQTGNLRDAAAALAARRAAR